MNTRPVAAWVTCVAAAIAGLAHAWAIADPISGQARGWLQITALSAFAALLLNRQSAHRVRRAALIGWVFATTSIAGATWWLFISMHVYGGLAAPLTVLAVLGLSAFLGLYWAAAAGALFATFKKKQAVASVHWLLFAIVFASFTLLTDLARAQAFTGFPWGTGAYAHVDGALVGLAPWVGAFGMSWVAALVAALIAASVVQRKLMPLALAIAIPLATDWLAPTADSAQVAERFAQVKGGGRRPGDTEQNAQPPGRSSHEALDAAAPRLTVRLLQGNIPQDEKFQPGTGVPLALDWYRAQLLNSPAALTIAPETAIPVLPARLPDGYWDQLGAHFAVPGRAALIGIPTGSFEQGYANSVVGLSSQAPYRYNKHHLVPFGEFIPPLFKWFVRMMNIPLGDFDAGPVAAPSFEWRTGPAPSAHPQPAGHGPHSGQAPAPARIERLAINICYEDLFGEELATRFADPAAAPTIFVNVSNIGWFGNTVAIDQHLNIARLRSIEFARPTLRATTTGATAYIDARGQVLAQMPRHERGVLDVALRGETDMTPYARWMARTGLWVWWAFGLGALALAWGAVRRSPARITTPI